MQELEFILCTYAQLVEAPALSLPSLFFPPSFCHKSPIAAYGTAHDPMEVVTRGGWPTAPDSGC
eukprot:scaffold137973_cov21-Tisochrysis_lutea.AAC.1